MGQVLYLISVIVAFYLGYSETNDLPLLFLVPIGFIFGYIFIRFPQLYSIWQSDGIRIVKIFPIQYVIYLIVSFIFYGIGIGLRSIL